jgi:hypothetical protein
MESYMNPVYLVVGTGRCGSSTVARIMHEQLGIKMGKTFVSTDVHGGFYEDFDFYVLNQQVYSGQIKLSEWFDTCQKLLIDRGEHDGPWGIKEPLMSYFLGQMIMFLDNFPRIIWTRRARRLVVKSMVTNWNVPTNTAIDAYRGREKILKRMLLHLPHLMIDFSDKRLEDDEIVSLIKRKWGDA